MSLHAVLTRAELNNFLYRKTDCTFSDYQCTLPSGCCRVQVLHAGNENPYCLHSGTKICLTGINASGTLEYVVVPVTMSVSFKTWSKCVTVKVPFNPELTVAKLKTAIASAVGVAWDDTQYKLCAVHDITSVEIPEIHDNNTLAEMNVGANTTLCVTQKLTLDLIKDIYNETTQITLAVTLRTAGLPYNDAEKSITCTLQSSRDTIVKLLECSLTNYEFEWFDTGIRCFDAHGVLQMPVSYAQAAPRMLAYENCSKFDTHGTTHVCSPSTVEQTFNLCKKKIVPLMYMRTHSTYRTCATQMMVLYENATKMHPTWQVQWDLNDRNKLLRVCRLLATVSQGKQWRALKPENIVRMCRDLTIHSTYVCVSDIVLQNVLENCSSATKGEPCILVQPCVKLIINCMLGYSRFQNLYDASESAITALDCIAEHNSEQQKICSILKDCVKRNGTANTFFETVIFVLTTYK